MEQLGDKKNDQSRYKGKSAVMELFESVAIAILLAVVIRFFILQPFVIPSGSMEPNLQIGDRIMVSKLSYVFSEPKRGDVIVFKYPPDPKRNFVKRAIGIPGETITIRDSQLYVDNIPTPEDYLPPGLQFADYKPVEVPAGEYFMLGDNRNNSDDSRMWGMVPEKNIIGKAVFIYWPLDRISLLRS